MTIPRLRSLLAAALLLVSFGASASEPVQFAFFNVNAPDTDDIAGIRFPLIYGKGNTNLRGWDFYLFAYSELDSLKGTNYGLFPGANRIRNEMVGWSTGIFNWHEGQDTGLNTGIVNIVNNVKGVNWALINISGGYSTVDLGIVNVSQKSNFQLSFVNVTQELEGVQVGLVNCAKNGFLPCFVLFNFSE